MGVKLHFSTWGTGPRSLVLLHGFTGNSGSWAPLRPLLEPRFSVLAVDLPGHGGSGLPTEAGRAGFEETLSALSALLEREGLWRTHLLGYSMGARLALALSLREPMRFERLVLESGSPGLRRRQQRQARRLEDERLASALERRGLAWFLDYWESLPIFSGVRRLPTARQQALRNLRAQATVEGLAGALRTLGTGTQPSFWSQLHQLRVPTLLLTGAEDAKFTGVASKMTEEAPLSWRRTFPGSGHVPHLEAGADYADEVVSFLNAPAMERRLDRPDEEGSAQ